MKSRQDKGEGKGMGGEDLHSRFERLENERIRARKAAEQASRKGSAPRSDAGRGIAHEPSFMERLRLPSRRAPTIYNEAPGGRAGMKGKRRG
jgi:hypothetical protein